MFQVLGINFCLFPLILIAKVRVTWSLWSWVIVGHQTEEVDVIDEMVEVFAVEKSFLIFMINRRWNGQDKDLVGFTDLTGYRLDLRIKLKTKHSLTNNYLSNSNTNMKTSTMLSWIGAVFVNNSLFEKIKIIFLRDNLIKFVYQLDTQTIE
jgi:hypothetical protein